MLAAILLAGLAALPANTDSLWQALRGRYLGLVSLSGNFHETVCSEAEGTCASFDGTFAVRLPGSYHMEVTSPQRQVIVGSDSVLWFHFPDEKRAVRQSGGQELPILAFLGPLLDTAATAAPDTNHLGESILRVITPDDDMASLYDLTLELSADGTRIDAFGFNDAWGNHYYFQLSDQKWNPVLADGLFRFTPPAGTDVE